MATPLLIVTPQGSFGSLIRKGLDASRYSVFSTPDFSEAIQYVRKANCALAILDAEMDDVDISILDIGHALRQINPGIRYVVVNPAGQDAQVGTLAPSVVLTKPISIFDLQNALDGPPALKTGAAANPGAPERLLAETVNLMWLKDVGKAAQHLTRLTLESSAQAALITRKNELWAYAGQLSREAAQELAGSVLQHWDKATESDLLKFVRLESTEAQHMLYARKLSQSMQLALVFDAEMPFSAIRAQAGKLVRTLVENNPFEIEDNNLPKESAPPLPEPSLAADDEEGDFPPISELLGDVPPPIPPHPHTTPKISLPWEQPRPVPLQPQPVLAKDEPKTTPPPQWSDSPVSAPIPVFSRETSPAVRMEAGKYPIHNLDETVVSKFSNPITDTETRTDQIPDDLAVTRKHEPAKDPQTLIETRPQAISESVTEVAHRILLEPASPDLVNLTYACLLIPRFDHHYLVGDAAERLAEWVPNVCVAFGWRLEHLAVRPDYLQWVVRVPPSTAPGYIMRL
ncbi:MAG: hypothetical protein EHM81_12985, partial [Chloroflexi bacterium]